MKDCCILLITETWLNPLIPDATMELAGWTAFCWYRNKDSGKTKGVGLCIYIHGDWCTNANIIDSHCSPDLEYLTVKCRPFYLPQEFDAVLITAVYIPTDANANKAQSYLLHAINFNQTFYPDAVHIIAGDFNHADLKRVPSKFNQRIKCATRGGINLDKVCYNFKKGYRLISLPHLGQSDHLSVLLMPTYTPLRRKTPTTTKIVKKMARRSFFSAPRLLRKNQLGCL